MIELNNIKFDTKKKTLDFIRLKLYDILNNMEACEYFITKENELFKFFKELAKYSPEKKKQIEDLKLRKIRVTHNPRNFKAFHTELIFKDESAVDISFLWCVSLIDSKDKECSKSDLLACMRKSIIGQIHDFKKTQIQKCELCNSKNELVVDHVIKFRDLVKDFLNKRNDNDIKFKDFLSDDPILGGSIFKKNCDFNDDWLLFHQKNSELRILCNKCNLKER
jgi:hypothetical protein